MPEINHDWKGLLFESNVSLVFERYAYIKKKFWYSWKYFNLLYIQIHYWKYLNIFLKIVNFLYTIEIT